MSAGTVGRPSRRRLFQVKAVNLPPPVPSTILKRRLARHIAIAEAVRRRRLRIGTGGGCQQRRSKPVGVSVVNPSVAKTFAMLAARVLRVQAIPSQLLPINDRGVALRYLHRARV
jgi:hypothetical protein